MIKHYLGLVSLLIFVSLFSSCTSPTVAPKGNYNSVAQKERIIYIRGEGQRNTLARYLKVVKEVSTVSNAGLFTGIVVFNNISKNTTLTCDVQFVFFDENDIEIEKTNWQPIQFGRGVDTTVKQVAINPNARDYKVYVRDPKS